MLNIVADDATRLDGRISLDAICREGAQRMLAAALEAEADAYVESFVDELDEAGCRLVVRNGHARARKVTTVAGAVKIEAPRVNDQRVEPTTGQRCGFKSAIVPPWARKSPKVTEVLPLLYLHGMSTGDFAPALNGFFGSAAGLSASAVGRLMASWQDEQRAFAARSLADRDFVGTVALGANRTILHRTPATFWCANRSGRPISVGANHLFRTPPQTGRRRGRSMQQCRQEHPQSAEIPRVAAQRRRCSRQRARVAPMLPTGMSSAVPRSA